MPLTSGKKEDLSHTCSSSRRVVHRSQKFCSWMRTPILDVACSSSVAKMVPYRLQKAKVGILQEASLCSICLLFACSYSSRVSLMCPDVNIHLGCLLSFAQTYRFARGLDISNNQSRLSKRQPLFKAFITKYRL